MPACFIAAQMRAAHRLLCCNVKHAEVLTM